MAGDYIPHSDAKFKSWAQAFMKYVEDHAEEIGLRPEELAELQAEQAEFWAKYADHYAAHTTAKAACAAKDEAKRRFTKSIRSVAMRMQKTPEVDKADKRGLGLSTGEPNRHPSLELSRCTPTALIDISNRLKHNIKIRNKTPGGVKKARPANAVGFEVWVRIGETPAGPGDMRLLDKVLQNRYMVEFSQADAGKQVHYAFRWVTRDGRKGSWSDLESATIAA